MPSRDAKEQSSFASRLAGLLRRPETDDPAVREVIEQIDQVQHRVAEIREEVKRGVRRREGRFSL